MPSSTPRVTQADVPGRWGRQLAYAVSKAALNAVTRLVAAELGGAGVLVNAVCPGWVATDMGGDGAEFTSRAFLAWAQRRGVQLQFIRPGKPVANAYIQSFNGRLRDECLNGDWFISLTDAQQTIERWRRDYNETRPHSSLAGRTPAGFAAAHATSHVAQQHPSSHRLA